jgi:hypothetical protein
MSRQIVYIGPERTTFEVRCDACEADAHRWGAAEVGAGVVEGSLRGDVDVGFRTCRRGHRILVRRVRMRSPSRVTAA